MIRNTDATQAMMKYVFSNAERLLNQPIETSFSKKFLILFYYTYKMRIFFDFA